MDIKEKKNDAQVNKDPHNIEISETGYGYVPKETNVENKTSEELESK